MAWAFFEDVTIVVHAPGAPSARDWDAHMVEARGRRLPKGVLVLAHDTRPSPKQRADIQQLISTNGARLAIVTESVMTRGAATALGWFGLSVKAFGTRDLDDAFLFLGIASRQHSAARSLIEDMERALRDQNLRP